MRAILLDLFLQKFSRKKEMCTTNKLGFCKIRVWPLCTLKIRVWPLCTLRLCRLCTDVLHFGRDFDASRAQLSYRIILGMSVPAITAFLIIKKIRRRIGMPLLQLKTAIFNPNKVPPQSKNSHSDSLFNCRKTHNSPHLTCPTTPPKQHQQPAKKESLIEAEPHFRVTPHPQMRHPWATLSPPVFLSAKIAQKKRPGRALMLH